MKKINTHCHTVGASPCGEVTPERLVDIYRAEGYDGLVLTNHYTRSYFEDVLDGSTTAEKTETFLSLYHRAKRAAEGTGFEVFFGAELNLSRYNRVGATYPVYEFLIFGLTTEFFLQNPMMFDWSQEEAFERFDAAGMLMIQTHPFRPRTRVADPFYEHGIEVLNGHPGHNSHNDLAMGFAACHPELLVTAGDDFHRENTQGYAGMYFPEDVRDEASMAEAIREHRTTIFTTGKIDPKTIRKLL